MLTKKIKIAVLDDHPLIIEGLRSYFKVADKYEIIKGFKTSQELFEYNNIHEIDILLLDLSLTDENGLDICKLISKKLPFITVLGMSNKTERSIILQMIHNGARGYILKSDDVTEFDKCITLALDGQIAFSKQIASIVEKIKFSDLIQSPNLTKRERDILLLLSEGKSTKEISEMLHLSFLTIQTYRRNMLEKFQVKNVAELVGYAIKNGLL